MFLGDFFNFLRHFAGAFSHHFGGFHSGAIVFQGDCQVCGVSDDHFCGGDFSHHSLHGGSHLYTPDLSFDFRGTFSLAVFFFDFLFAHFQIFKIFIANPDKIEQCQQ